MNYLRRLVMKLLRRRRIHAEMQAELALHRELSEENGNPIGLGHVSGIAESVLDLWRFTLIENAWRDVLFALRGWRRQPAYAVTCIGSLAIGIGLCTAMFTILNAVTLRPLPYADAQRLVWVTQVLKANSTDEVTFTPDFLDWRAANSTFQSMAAYTEFTRSLTGIAEPIEVHTAKASAALLPTLGILPLFGSNLPQSADFAGHERVALLSYATWRSRFNSNRSIAGKAIMLDGEPYLVVGVLPPAFLFPGPQQVDIITGLGKSEAAELARDGKVFTVVHHVIGRLKPGVTNERARQDLTGIQAHLPSPPWSPTIAIRLLPLREHLFGNAQTASAVLVAGALLFLLIASTNAGSLSLVRLMQRDREISIRRAVGAAHSRIVSQLLIESSVLGVLAAALGILVAMLIRTALLVIEPYRNGVYGNLPIDPRVIAFAAVLLMLTILLFGVLPVVRSRDLDLGRTIAAGQSSVAGKRNNIRTLSLVAAAEIAIVIGLSSSAALMLKSFWNMRYKELGFEPKQLIAATLNLGSSRYTDKQREFSFISQLLYRAAAIPGVEAVAPTIASEIPPGGGHATNNVRIEGRALPINSRQKALQRPQEVNAGYFRLLDIPLLEGRFLRDTDRAGSLPVVVVNHQFAQRYFPADSAVGHRLETFEMDNTWYTIVGVVGDVKTSGLAAHPEPVVYTPYDQSDGQRLRDLGIVMRCALPVSSIAAEFRRIVSGIDPEQPIASIQTIDERLSESVSRPHFTANVLLAFSCLGVLLAVIGVYGALNCRVRLQMREMAVRQALGAQPVTVVSHVLGQALRLVVSGLLGGVGLAFLGNRLISGLLFEVKPSDPKLLAAVCMGIILAAFAASFLPALRAARLDPLISLRHE